MRQESFFARLRTGQAGFLLAVLALLVPAGQAVAEKSETVTYYHTDGLGSVIAASDEAGNLLWRERYRPFGERLEQTVSTDEHALYYTGKPHDDDIGLTYFGARYYDPMVGRFMGGGRRSRESAFVQPVRICQQQSVQVCGSGWQSGYT